VNLVLVSLRATTLPLASAASSDETNLLARHTGTSRSGGMTDVLVVTTSVRVLHWIHCTATNLGPAVALDAVLVVGTPCLHDGLVQTTTTSYDTDGSTASVLHPLLRARRKADFGALLIDVLSNNGAVVARATRNHTTIARAGLNIGDDGTLGHRLEGECVARDQLSLLAAVQELTSVCTLDCRHQLFVDLVSASIVECNFCQRCATAWVVNDFLHDTLDEANALAEVEDTKLGCSLAGSVVRLEDGSTTLTLASDDTTHGLSAVVNLPWNS